MKNLLRISLSVFALSILASAVHAEDKPLLSVERVSLGAGFNYAFHAAPFETSAPLPEFRKEFEAGLYGAYNLTPHLSAVASSVYGLDNKTFRTSLGVRIRLFQGGK